MGKGFREFRIQGRTHRVSHLRPMTLSRTTEAFPHERVKVLVTFSSHCWSVAYDRDAHTPDLAFNDEEGRKRAFSAVRHADSMALPDLLADAWGRTVRHTARRNHVMVAGGDDGEGALNVFLGLKPSRQRRADVHCLVQSAYRRVSTPARTGPETPFGEAVDLALGAGLLGHDGTGKGSRRLPTPRRFDRLLDLADDYALIG